MYFLNLGVKGLTRWLPSSKTRIGCILIFNISYGKERRKFSSLVRIFYIVDVSLCTFFRKENFVYCSFSIGVEGLQTSFLSPPEPRCVPLQPQGICQSPKDSLRAIPDSRLCDFIERFVLTPPPWIVSNPASASTCSPSSTRNACWTISFPRCCAHRWRSCACR